MDPLDLNRPDGTRDHSPSWINAELDAEARRRVDALPPDEPALRERLAELDREWSMDRALMLNFALVGGTTFALGVRELARRTAFRRRRWNGWLTFFSVQLGFLAHHALRGWCPPVAAFRRLGFRTAREIEAERHAVARRLVSH